MIAYKLFRRRNDGTLGPLFINRKQRIPINRWLRASNHPTKGFAIRPGFHTTEAMYAPHLTSKREKRVWKKVEIRDYKHIPRPANQGVWYLAKYMRVL